MAVGIFEIRVLSEHVVENIKKFKKNIIAERISLVQKISFFKIELYCYT